MRLHVTVSHFASTGGPQMNRFLLPFATLAIGLIPMVAEAQVRVDIGEIGKSAGECLVGVVPPASNISFPEGVPVKTGSPTAEAWGIIVDRMPRIAGAVAAPCARRPSRAIVCFLDESIKLTDARVPGMLGAGLNALLARETQMSRPTFRPTHDYTTKNGRSEFSCNHPLVRTNCRWVPGKVTEREECDLVSGPGHNCWCTSGCN